ncbi:MAG TPA: DUF4058 family protein [Gemmataceae bacterium]|nr:DUF4058 family protein [Gemmataceae bacterium]
MPVHDWTRVDAGIFHDFHTMWLVTLRNALKRVLPTGYYALTEQKALGYGPDVLTLGRSQSPTSNGSGNGPAQTSGADGGIHVATAPPKVLISRSSDIPRNEYKRRWIAVRHVSGDRVVAILEVVSPGNKWSDEALRAFTAKAAEFLENGIHVSVIDLFPPTPRDPDGIHRAIWAERAGDYSLAPNKPLTLVSYVAGHPERAYVQPVGVGEDLPDLALFLTEERYVLVPLEATYSTAFAEVDERWQKILTGPAA